MTDIHDVQTPMVDLRHARFGEKMTTISDDGVRSIGFIIGLRGELNACGQPSSPNNIRRLLSGVDEISFLYDRRHSNC